MQTDNKGRKEFCQYRSISSRLYPKIGQQQNANSSQFCKPFAELVLLSISWVFSLLLDYKEDVHHPLLWTIFEFYFTSAHVHRLYNAVILLTETWRTRFERVEKIQQNACLSFIQFEFTKESRISLFGSLKFTLLDICISFFRGVSVCRPFLSSIVSCTIFTSSNQSTVCCSSYVF